MWYLSPLKRALDTFKATFPSEDPEDGGRRGARGLILEVRFALSMVGRCVQRYVGLSRTAEKNTACTHATAARPSRTSGRCTLPRSSLSSPALKRTILFGPPTRARRRATSQSARGACSIVPSPSSGTMQLVSLLPPLIERRDMSLRRGPGGRYRHNSTRRVHQRLPHSRWARALCVADGGCIAGCGEVHGGEELDSSSRWRVPRGLLEVHQI